MQSRTFDFLCNLLEVLAFLSRPTLANAMHGSRYWGRPAVRERNLSDLSKRGYLRLEKGDRSPKDRIVRLTEKGRLRALGGRDPEICWSRPWDGKWRMVLFDIPEKDKRLRDKLRRHLHAQHFGYLQNSVWVSPDPLDFERQIFKGSDINAESLLTLDAMPGTGEKNSDIVQGAWDFDEINTCYAEHLEILNERPAQDSWASDKGKSPLGRWIKAEREAWQAAVSIDPLLPRPLCPPGYLGEKAWKLRGKTLETIARKLAKMKLFD
jgi:phenylacetic acid degradation operon negative regulatory protein